MSSTFVRIGRFVLDVSLSEEHKFESDITDFPVESGGSISDNIRQKPVHVSITGIVTDTPLGSNAVNKPISLSDPYTETTFTVDAVSGGANTETTNSTAAKPETVEFLRSEQAYAYLKSIYESRDTVTIRTSLGTFDNMALESLSVPRSKETTGGLTFTADFKQIRRVTNQRVRTAIRNGGGKTKRGAKPTTGREGQILWRVGDPAGSFNIVRTYWVSYTPTINPIKGGFTGNTGQGWFFRSGPRALGAGGPAIDQVFNPGTLFQTTIQGSQLSHTERVAFDKDYKRDKQEAEDQKAIDGIQRSGSFRNWSGPDDITNRSNLSKTMSEDLSDKSRVMKDAEAISSDPSFQNKGNFSDTPKNLTSTDYSDRSKWGK